MNFKKSVFAIMICVALCLFAACSTSGDGGGSGGNGTTGNIGSEVLAKDEMFSSRDENSDYDEENAVRITLSDNGSTASSPSVSISGNVVTISDEGTYVLTGSLSDGQIVVDAEKTDKIQLVLDGVTVTKSSSAALYVKQADKVFVTLKENTKNLLASCGEFVAIDDNNIDGAIFSKEDLTINGSGSLDITCETGHGVVSKDELIVTGGKISVKAKKHALSGKDCVKISGGELSLTAEKDGIHAENADDTALGYIYIAGGNFEINSESDGIDASAFLQIIGGSFEFNCGGKGVKAVGNMTITGGNFSLTTVDDGVHSNASIVISGGTFAISTGDDGFHADETLAIAGGEIAVSESYEGLEGETVEISGGTINIVASDDGINAAGGNDESGFGGSFGGDRFGGFSSGTIKISGGIIYIDAASGDGIDSNGEITVSGGEVYVSGATNGGNSALDYDGSATISGGTFIATGYSQMAQNFGNDSTQGSILLNLSSTTTEEIIVTDEAGNVLASYVPTKNYNSVVISCAGLEKGGTYTISIGGETTSITLTSLIYGSGMGGGFGGNPFDGSGENPFDGGGENPFDGGGGNPFGGGGRR